MFASVSREQSEPFEFASQLGVKFNKSAGNPEASSPSLSADPAPASENHDIEPLCHLGREQRLPHIGARRLTDEIVFKRPVIDGDLTFSRPQEHARRRGLAPPGPQMLN